MSKHLCWIMTILACCALQAATGPALAETFMLIEDSSSKLLAGPDIAPDGTPGAIAVYGFHHLLRAPGGSAIEHHPLIVTKQLDLLTARLFHESFVSGRLGVKLQTFSGTVKIYELELVDAVIVGIEPITITTGLSGHYERIRFQYGQIIIKDILNGSQTILVVP